MGDILSDSDIKEEEMDKSVEEEDKHDSTSEKAAVGENDLQTFFIMIRETKSTLAERATHKKWAVDELLK